MPTCPSCSAEVSAGSNKCPACGRPLKASADESTWIPAELPADDPTHDVSPAAQDATAAHHGRFLPGTLLAKRYRIVAMIGRGGMGEVYRADDLQLGQQVALKFLPEAMTEDNQRLESLHNEVRLARQVSHPNVCRVYDVGEVDGLHYLSMEYVDGEDLKSLLRRIGRIPGDKGVEISRQLCAGLAAAHSKGVLHRDLKPLNVMLDARGQARIMDFGLARAFDDQSQSEVLVGTPAYMAPEQLRNNETTVQSDLYSLGLTLYELLTGKQVFRSDSLAERFKPGQDPTIAIPSSLVEDLDPAIEWTILRCLDASPDNRPASALAVMQALPGGDALEAALLAGETPSPELVAATGGSGAIRPVAGLACLVTLIVGLLILLLVLADSRRFTTNGLSQKPAVLEARSREILASLTAVDPQYPPADTAFGFRYDEDLIGHAKNSATGVLEFWYRQSPYALTPVEPDYATGHLPRMVSLANPIPASGGMASVRITSDGSLRELLAVPNPSDDHNRSPNSAQSDDTVWRSAFKFADLDYGDFHRCEPRWAPPVYADDVANWCQELGDGNGQSERRVEAASLHGSIVYFQVIEPWTTRQWTVTQQIQTAFGGIPYRSGSDRLPQRMVAIVAVLLGAWVARRNWRLGRCDRNGAWRIALLMFTLELLVCLLKAHHYPALRYELDLVLSSLGRSVFRAFRIWIYYLALEPYVRRIWPRSLTAWARAVGGSWRDPLVGRDVLIGAAVLFPCMALLDSMHLNYERHHSLSPEILLGGRHIIAALIEGTLAGINVGLYLLMLMLLFRLLLRNEWLAAAAFTLLLTTMTGIGSPSVVSWIVYALRSAAIAILVTRLGLLATVVVLSCMFFGLAFPVSADLTAWYARCGLPCLGMICLLAAYGFYVSLGGRSIWRDPSAVS